MEEMAAKLERSEAGRKKLRLAISLLKEKVEASEKVLEANGILRSECEKEKLAAEVERNKAEEEKKKRLQIEKEGSTVKQQLTHVLQRLDAVERDYKSDHREIERMRKEAKQSVLGLGGVVKSLQDAEVSILDLNKDFSGQVTDAISTSRASSTLAQRAITDAKAAQEAATAAARQVRSLVSKISSLEDKNARLEQRLNDIEQEQRAGTGGHSEISALEDKNARLEQRLNDIEQELRAGTGGHSKISALEDKNARLEQRLNDIEQEQRAGTGGHRGRKKGSRKPSMARKVVSSAVTDCGTTPQLAGLDRGACWKGSSAIGVGSSTKEQSAVTDSVPHVKVDNGRPPAPLIISANPDNSRNRSQNCPSLSVTKLKKFSNNGTEDEEDVKCDSKHSAPVQDDRSAVSKRVTETAAWLPKQGISALGLLRDIQMVSQKERKCHSKMERKLAAFEKFLRAGADCEEAKVLFRSPKKASKKRKKESLDKSGKRARVGHVEGKTNLISDKSGTFLHPVSRKEVSKNAGTTTLCQAGFGEYANDPARALVQGSRELEHLQPPRNKGIQFPSDEPTCDGSKADVCPIPKQIQAENMESEELSHACGFDSETSEDGLGLDWWSNWPVLLSPTLPDIPSPVPFPEMEGPCIFSTNPASDQMNVEEKDHLLDGRPLMADEASGSITIEAPMTTLIDSISKIVSRDIVDKTVDHEKICESETNLESPGCHRSFAKNLAVAGDLVNTYHEGPGISGDTGKGQADDTGKNLRDFASEKRVIGPNNVNVILDCGDVMAGGECHEGDDESQQKSTLETLTTIHSCLADSTPGNELEYLRLESGSEMSGNLGSYVEGNGNIGGCGCCLSGLCCDLHSGNSAVRMALERSDGSNSGLVDPSAMTFSKLEDKGELELLSKPVTTGLDSVQACRMDSRTGSELFDRVFGIEHSGTSYEQGKNSRFDSVGASPVSSFGGDRVQGTGIGGTVGYTVSSLSGELGCDFSGLATRRKDLSSWETAVEMPIPAARGKDEGTDINLAPTSECCTFEKTINIADGSLQCDLLDPRVASMSASESGILLSDTFGEARSEEKQESLGSISHDDGVPQIEERSHLFCLEIVLGHLMDGKNISPSISMDDVSAPSVAETSEKISLICGITQKILHRALNHGDTKCVHSGECSSKVAIELASVLLSSKFSHPDLLGIFTASLVDSHALWDFDKTKTCLFSEDKSLQLLMEVVKQVLVTEVFQRTLPAEQAFSSFAYQLQRFLIFGNITLFHQPVHRDHFGKATSGLQFHFIPSSIQWKRLMALISGSKLLAAFCEILGDLDFLRNCIYIVLRFCVLDSSCLLATISSFASICCKSVFSIDQEDVVGQAIHLVVSELLSQVMADESLVATSISPMKKGDSNEESQEQLEYLMQESVNLPQLLGNLSTLRKVIPKSEDLNFDTLLPKLVKLFTDPISPDFSSQCGRDRHLFQRKFLVHPWQERETNRKCAAILSDNSSTRSAIQPETGDNCDGLDRPAVSDATSKPTSPVECYWECSANVRIINERTTSDLDQSGRTTESTDKWKQMLHDVTSAMELISSHLGWEWTYNSLIIEHLWNLLGPGAQAMTAACVAHLFGRLGCLGKEAADIELPGVDELRKTLQVILNSDTCSPQLSCVSKSAGWSQIVVFRAQAAAAESLLLLSTCSRNDIPDSGTWFANFSCHGPSEESVEYLRKWVTALEPDMKKMLPVSLTSVFCS